MKATPNWGSLNASISVGTKLMSMTIVHVGYGRHQERVHQTLSEVSIHNMWQIIDLINLHLT
jgi:hypothetical protein